MRALVQRVSRAQVRVGGEVVGEIGAGICVLLGVGPDDDEATAEKMASKLQALRIFEDADGKMNEALGGALRGTARRANRLGGLLA